MNSIIAIDPGTDNTGLIKFDGSKTTAKTITPHRRKVAFAKIYSMAKRICSNISDGDFIVMEDYGFGGSFFNAQVAELVSLIKNYLYKAKANYMMVVAPNTVKKIVTGNGKASKAKMKKAVKEMAAENGVKFTSSHEADGYSLMIVYLRYIANGLDAGHMRSLKSRITNYKTL